jgi:endopeptidase La
MKTFKYMDIIDLLNKLANNKKRKASDMCLEFSSNELIEYTQKNMIEKLMSFLNLKLKNKDMVLVLNTLKENITQIFKSGEAKIKNTTNKNNIILISLNIQLCMCVDIINKILFEYSKDKTLTLGKYFKIIDSNTNDERKSKRIKTKKNDELDDIIDYEEVYDDNDDDDEADDDDGDDDDDDDDEDNDEDISRPRNLRFKENKEFFNELARSNVIDSNGTILDYFSNLTKKEKVESLNQIKNINNYQSNETPLLFKIIMLNIPIVQKNHILKKYLTMISTKGESTKLKTWVESIMTIPFGEYTNVNFKNYNTSQIKQFLKKLENTMDSAVWGHDDAKRHIIQIVGQQFRNPESKGNMIGIWGPPGNGKTTLIKEGIAKAMNKPFIFISLGGATDSSFLEGHSYTYEGSVCGRIAQGLMNAKCMDPIIYFDELDKISKTHKGEEITNLLIHLTDPVQNSHFRDKYFHGIDMDLSRVTFIFSYNDPSLVDHVLMDRISQVETKFLLQKQKVYIAQNYLIPTILKEVGLSTGSIVFSDEILESIIDKYTNEGGVRKLKNYIYNIVRELNIYNLTKNKLNNKNVSFPFVLSEENITFILKNKNINPAEKIHDMDKCGVINGLYATTGGTGGIMPIEILWTPSMNPFEIKATGNLQNVIKESTQVASTLAFNHISKEIQESYLKKWKETPQGLHIHCPDGSVPKDGPSAGTALTVAIYSILINKKIKHDIAITGEINLQGCVTAIGGLENKLEGAKKAGIKLVLYPKENQKDIDKIIERNPTLIDSELHIKAIETIEDAIKYAII